MGFQELKSLEDKLAQLKRDLSDFEGKLKTQNKRLERVGKISSSISSTSSNGSSDVSQVLKTMKSELEQSMQGIKSESTLSAKITADLEKDCTSDTDLNEAKAQIDSEKIEVQNKIQELENNISTTKTNIANTEESIRRERHAIAASYKTALDQAVRKLLNLEEAVKQDPTNADLQRQYDQAKMDKNNAQSEYNKYSGWY